jgi:hypothetical protein
MENELNQTLLWLVLQFLKRNDESGISKHEMFFYPQHLQNLPLIPSGKVVKVTIELVSQAKLENRPE